MSKRTHRTMQGREIDMDAMRARNELTVAVGNVSVNARGDQIKGGRIIKPRDQVVAEYYDTNPNAVPRQNLVEPEAESYVVPAPEVTKKPKTVPKLTQNSSTEE